MFLINADDYGFNKEATLAIIESFKNDWIHTTTACSNGSYFKEAVALAIENNVADKIGLHLNITEGRPLTDAIKNDPFFCDEDGCFHGNINRYKPISRKQKKEIEEELQAQFDCFIQSGMKIHHLDSHHHIHTAANMAHIFVCVAQRNGVTFIRQSRNVNVQGIVKPFIKSIYNGYLKKKGVKQTAHMGSIDDYTAVIFNSKWSDIDEVMVHPTYTKDGVLVDNHSETFDPKGPLLADEIKKIKRVIKIPEVNYLSNAPAPYRVKFWNELGKKIKLTVLFELDHSGEREKEWTSGQSVNYQEVVLPAMIKRVNDAFCPSVIRYLKRNKINIVANYNTPTGIISILYMRIRKIPFVISIDGGMIKNDSAFIYTVKKSLLSHARYWLSTSKQADNYLVHYGAEKARIFRYPFTSLNSNYVCESFPGIQIKKQLREELGMPEQRVIISVGRFIKSKAFNILLEACNIMPKDIGVYIIGGVPTEEYLALQKKYNLDQVHFLQHMDQARLKQYYMAADCFVMPTLTDVWGLVVNEAMANGLPVVTTDHCVAGVEMIDEGRNGFIIPINDFKTLAERTMTIMNDSVLREKMSENAIRTAQKYTLENMVYSHLNFLHTVCNGEIRA